MSDDPTWTYDAFISYSRADSDLAERLSRRIRTYLPPRASEAPRRRLEVFRDVERLTASADLTQSLTREVGRSRSLVLVASPDAADSTYVDREVRAFLDARGPENVVVALARGSIEEALPPSGSPLREALYVDVQDDDRKAFRLASLRLIAALFGVDYEELRREDDGRRRRRRSLLGAAAVISLFLLASAYLVWTTPARVWARVRQPVEATWSNALAPVQRFLVRRDDPSTVVWLGRNARHARDLDADTRAWLAPGPPAGFTERAEEEPPPWGGGPAAELDLRIGRDGEAGRIEVTVFALRDGDETFFLRLSTLRDAAGATLRLPPRRVFGPDPFDLEPEIADALRERDTPGEAIAGTLTDHTDGGRRTPVRYLFHDFRDDAMEVLDAVSSREYLVFTNDAELQARLDSALENEAGDVLFEEMTASGDWIGFREPDVEAVTIRSRRPDDDPGGRERLALEAGLEAGLARAVARVMGDEPADFYQVRVLRRDSAELVVIEPIRDSHEVVQQPAPVRLVRTGRGRGWVPARLPSAPRTPVVDLVPGPGPGALFAVTEGEGILASGDGGLTWTFANHGNGDLLRAGSIRLIAVGGATWALALVSREPGADVNPLLRLTRRSWLDRWRIGLSDLLREGVAGEER